MKKTNVKEKIFITAFLLAMIVSFGVVTAKAEYSAYENGRTMAYNLTLSSNDWKAYTYCCEDASSFVSMFLYNKANCGGDALWADSKTIHERTWVSFTSATCTYASLNKTNSSAKSARSGHALKEPNTNIPCLDTLYLNRNK